MAMATTSDRTAVVERDFEGFRQGDHEAILGCLTDDVVWDLPGFRHPRGKTEFRAVPSGRIRLCRSDQQRS